MYGFKRSPHNNTPEKTPNNIIKPPIVGVPIFFTICSVGPSFLIGLCICLDEKKLINGVPTTKTTIIEVNIDNPVLTVKYLNTLKKLKISTKLENKLNNINSS